MPAILPSLPIDHSPTLAKLFMPHQIHWIEAEEHLRARGQQTFALAEKSVRIGWTYADAFKNVRKRLRLPNRDYLFATKDYPSALEFMRVCKQIAELFDYTRSILSHGEEFYKIPRPDENGHPTAFTDEINMGVIKFDNGSRIIAFSSHPQAMSVYGGDVGLDEFAKHQNARLLWETAQGRVAWGGDLAVWSSHDGEDTLFNEFAQEARSGVGPWNLYYKVTLPDAIEMGLLDVINRVHGTRFTAEQFIAGCKARARQDDIFEQTYMCNPLGAVANHIVEWSAIERCRYHYEIDRVHLEADDIKRQFGEFDPHSSAERERKIKEFLTGKFTQLSKPKGDYHLGFDVAASGQGDLAAIYIDKDEGSHLQLCALFTARTEDWHFLKTVLFHFMKDRRFRGAGDESGIGRQICWEATRQFGSRFLKVNFASKKHDLGFALMNQLAVAEKRFPRSQQDIAADYYALRKAHNGARWSFSESRNHLNLSSHCDIAWAGALATHTKGNKLVGPLAFVV